MQTMDRQKYKSYTKAVVAALNDYFAREYRNKEDPYLETREKEDAFLERVETAIRNGVKESVPMAMAKNLIGDACTICERISRRKRICRTEY